MSDEAIRQVFLDNINEKFILGGAYELNIDDNKLNEAVQLFKKVSNIQDIGKVTGAGILAVTLVQKQIDESLIVGADIQTALSQDKYNPNTDPNDIIKIPIARGETSKSAKIAGVREKIPRDLNVLDEIIIEGGDDLLVKIIDHNDEVLYEIPIVDSVAKLDPPLVMSPLAYMSLHIKVINKDGNAHDGDVICGGRNLMEVIRHNLQQKTFFMKNDSHVFNYRDGLVMKTTA